MVGLSLFESVYFVFRLFSGRMEVVKKLVAFVSCFFFVLNWVHIYYSGRSNNNQQNNRGFGLMQWEVLFSDD